VAFALILITAITPWSRPRTDSLVLEIGLGAFLAMPVFFAAGSGTSLGRLKQIWISSRGFQTFVLVRPMTSGGLVAAKFRMALASVLLSWSITIVLMVLWVITRGRTAAVPGLVLVFFHHFGAGRGAAILALAIVLLPALTWKHFTDGVAPVLTGRRWIADATVYAFLVFITVLAAIIAWLANHPADLPRLIAAIPWLAVLAALVKGIVAVAAFRATLRLGLIDPPAVWRILAGWLVFSSTASALAYLLASAGPEVVPKIIMVLGVAAFVPLARFPLSILALEWNRHR